MKSHTDRVFPASGTNGLPMMPRNLRLQTAPVIAQVPTPVGVWCERHVEDRDHQEAATVIHPAQQRSPLRLGELNFEGLVLALPQRPALALWPPLGPARQPDRTDGAGIRRVANDRVRRATLIRRSVLLFKQGQHPLGVTIGNRQGLGRQLLLDLRGL